MQAGESWMIRRLPPRPKNLFQPRQQQLTWAAHAATSCLLFARDKQGGILFSDVFKLICDKWTLAEECPPYLLEVLVLFAVALGCKHLQRCAALLLGQYYLWCCWRSYCVWSCEMSIGIGIFEWFHFTLYSWQVCPLSFGISIFPQKNGGLGIFQIQLSYISRTSFVLHVYAETCCCPSMLA